MGVAVGSRFEGGAKSCGRCCVAGVDVAQDAVGDASCVCQGEGAEPVVEAGGVSR